MTEREKWEAGLWYDANYTPELCAEREKAEELYTEFNQTRPSEKAKRAELLRQLLPHMEEHVVILPHLYVDYGYHCFIGAGTYINHGAYLMDCAKITLGRHCFIGPNCGMYTAIHPMLPEERNSGLETTAPITLGDNVWLGGDVTILPGVTIGSNTVIGAGSVVTKDIPSGVVAVGNPCKVLRPITEKTASGIRNKLQQQKAEPLNFQRFRFLLWKIRCYFSSGSSSSFFRFFFTRYAQNWSSAKQSRPVETPVNAAPIQ